MATDNIKGRIPGPLTTCSTVAEAYYRKRLNQLDYDKGQKVKTKYGTTWAYRLGPRGNGPKILFIHGINTSCHSLADIAVPLSEQGCEVLLYDLYGRGLSDGTMAKHDAKLYTDQASEVLAEFGWNEDITVVGYSMGGALAVHLNKSRPGLIQHLILLAPAGMIRHRTLGLHKIGVSWCSQGAKSQDHFVRTNAKEGIAKVEEKKAQGAGGADDPGKGVVDLEEVVVRSRIWFLDNHDGFASAVMASTSQAPLCRQKEAWELLRGRKGTTKVILGFSDDKIIRSQFKADVEALDGGADHLNLEIWDGVDHHFPMTHAGRVLKVIEEVLKPKVGSSTGEAKER